MKIGFTASRDGISLHQLDLMVRKMIELGITEFHQGCCVGGDYMATKYVLAYFSRVKVVAHPPIDTKLLAEFCVGVAHEVREAKDYLARNKDIVDETSILIAAPKG